MGITHPFVCALPDNAAHAAAGKVVTTDWNAEHVVDYLTLTHGTITAAQPTIDASVTWNNAGVAFTGWKLNVTDTASADASAYIDVQVGGTSFFKVYNDTASPCSTTLDLKSRVNTFKMLRLDSNNLAFQIVYNGSPRASWTDYSLNVCNYFEGIVWATSGSDCREARDTGIGKSAAGIVEINNGTIGTLRDIKVRNVLAAGGNGSYIQTPSMTVTNLPAAGTAGAGARAFVTDATATTFLSTVAGGGANKVPVVSDGTNWLIG